jgi:hypothetical protein
MFLSRDQNSDQNHDLNIANTCFENVAQFKYLGTTITNQNLIHKEIKRRLNSDKTIIFPMVLYECETWSLTVRKEHRVEVFENRVLRSIIWTEER